jgi:hypothetical protein
MTNSTFLSSELDYYLEQPLYESIDLSSFETEEQKIDFINAIRYPEKTVDAYCLECEKLSTFRPVKGNRLSNSLLLRDGQFEVIFTCTRNGKHQMLFFFLLKGQNLFKVGQYPSIADLSLPKIEQYRKVISNEEFIELSKAIGLDAHGIGIGSFVYLRRIFERLIEEAQLTEQKLNPSWDERLYKNAKVNERIEMLKNRLPQFLVKNKHIYGILSKGIHELTEKECKQHFKVVQAAIELILDEKREQQFKQEKIKEAEKQLNELNQSLKSK